MMVGFGKSAARVVAEKIQTKADIQCAFMSDEICPLQPECERVNSPRASNNKTTNLQPGATHVFYSAYRIFDCRTAPDDHKGFPYPP